MRVRQYKNYKRILHILFSSDETFVKLCNRNEGDGLEDAVERTSNMFSSSIHDLKFFVVLDSNRLVGYFATEDLEGLPLLSGSFVLPKYRNREDLTRYWSQIKKYFNGNFFAALPIANQRAISSYEKSGGKIMGNLDINKEAHVFLRFSED